MNIYIETWKNTINALITGEKILNENLNVEKKAMEYARYQYGEIYKNRPNKDLTPEEQANEKQLEFIEYLKYVKETGNYMEK